MHILQKALAWALAGALLSVEAAALAASPPDLETLAERLVELRSEVEELQVEIESTRQSHRNRMATLSQRRASLESQVQAKALQLRQIRRTLEEQRAKTRAQNEAAEAMTPAVRSVAAMLTAYIDASIPFKLEDRRSAIDDVLKKMDAGDISAPRALNRLWSLYEDELRIAKENGVFRQTITVDGQEQLADVLRLGTMMMFFRTSGGAHGAVRRAGDAWTYEVLDEEDAKLVAKLFSSFEKQVRTGFFSVPNAIVEAPR